MTHAATGVPVTIFGIVLLIAAPAAFAIVALLAATGQQGLNSIRTPDDADGALNFAVLGLPAVAFECPPLRTLDRF